MKEDKELEAERLSKLAELRKQDQERGEKQPLEFRYGPESFGCHEALHVTNLILDLIERELTSHGAIVQNAEWYAHVRRAQDELAALYQKIGAAQLAGTDQRH
ncbi:hypothetical protein [Sinorhizobium meliloti]|uniref:hypothetical protein n=1 Tax=Rhizobium meliloti TaxID=382 RepID=UPI000FD8B244|nr:hypothetical protein [Sinorhizobium meliloti]RVI34235.1 hypothetical protein CN207_01190 [Sinorhizobium meliloti]